MRKNVGEFTIANITGFSESGVNGICFAKFTKVSGFLIRFLAWTKLAQFKP